MSTSTGHLDMYELIRLTQLGQVDSIGLLDLNVDLNVSINLRANHYCSILWTTFHAGCH